MTSTLRPARRRGSSLTGPDILSSDTPSTLALWTDEGSLARRSPRADVLARAIKNLGVPHTPVKAGTSLMRDVMRLSSRCAPPLILAGTNSAMTAELDQLYWETP
jgi:hypothetical protein